MKGGLMDKVSKEQLLREVATLYKGITVLEFQKRFGGMSAGRIFLSLRLAKAIFAETGVVL